MIITALTASVLTLLLIILSIDAIKRRKRLGVAFGDGGDPGLASAIRAHANLTEYMPIGLTLIGLLEAHGANRIVLGTMATLFVAGRYLHANGLYRRDPAFNAPRSMGISATILLLAAMALWLAVLVASAELRLTGPG